LFHLDICSCELVGYYLFVKGAMCNKVEYLLTEMQYDIHNYVFSGVYRTYLISRNVFITLE